MCVFIYIYIAICIQVLDLIDELAAKVTADGAAEEKSFHEYMELRQLSCIHV